MIRYNQEDERKTRLTGILECRLFRHMSSVVTFVTLILDDLVEVSGALF